MPRCSRAFPPGGGWLLTAALTHPASGPLWARSGFLPHWRNTAAPLTIRVRPAPPPPAAQPAPPPAEADAGLRQALLQSFAWQYPRRALRDIPAKVSVTAVTHGAAGQRLERPGFPAEIRADRRRAGGPPSMRFCKTSPLTAPPPTWTPRSAARPSSGCWTPNWPATSGWRRCAPSLKARSGAGSAWPAGCCGRNPSSPRCRPARSPADRPETGPLPDQAQVLVQGIADLVLGF